MSSSSPVLLLSCALATVGWIISFAGLCVSGTAIQPLSWWTIVYELVLTLLVCLAVWTRTIHTYQPAILALIAISIPYSTDQVALYITGASPPLSAVVAGYIVMMVTQFSWLFLLCHHQEATLFQSLHNVDPATYMYRPNLSSSMVCMKQQPMCTDSAQPSYPPTTLSHDAALPVFVPSQHNADPAIDSSTVFVSPYADYHIPVLAIHSYEANPDDPNELSFTKGETMHVHEKKGNWWQARNANGTVGLVPSNYMKPLTTD